MNQHQKGKIRDGTTHHGSSCVSVFWHQLGTLPCCLHMESGTRRVSRCPVVLTPSCSFQSLDRSAAPCIFQCPNLPTHCPHGFHCNRIHVGRDAAEDESGAYLITRDQILDHAPIFHHPHFATDHERNGVGKFAALHEALANFSRDPGSDAQNLQDFPKR